MKITISVIIGVIVLFLVFMKYVFQAMDHDSITLFENDIKRILKAANNSECYDRQIMIDSFEYDEIPLEAANEMIAAKYDYIDNHVEGVNNNE
jgi:hypothetical protein